MAGEAGETDGCRGECASNRDPGRSLCSDARCFARVEKICWSACIDEILQLKIIKGRAVSDLLRDSQLFVGYAFTHGLPPVARGESDTS